VLKTQICVTRPQCVKCEHQNCSYMEIRCGCWDTVADDI